jgi:hypothetical protein
MEAVSERRHEIVKDVRIISEAVNQDQVRSGAPPVQILQPDTVDLNKALESSGRWRRHSPPGRIHEQHKNAECEESTHQ